MKHSPVNTLIKNVKQCTLCQKELPFTANPVLQYSHKSKILLAGQAPGVSAHTSSTPFADQSGKRLTQWLQITDQQLYNDKLFSILPMGFCYPGKSKSGDLPPIKRCANTWREPLLATFTNCQFTILLGKYAANWHLSSSKPLTELCKQWPSLLEDNTIVLPHPSPRNIPWITRNPWFEQDLLPALRSRLNTIINE
ncbi:uracil-DNA glycosylase family protein [Thalassotalea sp. 1_MG-2023]|uniref:uracil-DNA glycosylase family protein n=1 Tax=Thalassotalea sp. 1_MG-2023 TaxID=3062680 RepID=UPI0026E304C8|nr:uracil-DNA glycosylase family protein [Thalassotalea sp. 1_MG-2023]MDO6427314.1 uracil-DNA glycosylase family protein [Thalassotalea sp. 1_MG-2023]